ncbi:MAG TPA: cytochrome b/b6 domain-containing protein [Oligoflexia bacterium]|nr:cytochrome b/b6 domain-containing protein [Oligoflexia bacterium]
MSDYNFKRHLPLSLRLWHWFNAVVLLGLLGTVLLRKTFLSWRTNSALIEAQFAEAGITVPPELAKKVAVAIRNPLWDWHVYLGFALLALYLARILVAVFVEKECVYLRVLKSAVQIKSLPPGKKPRALHYTLVKAGYAAFYFVTALMLITGLLLNFKSEFGIAKHLIETIKETHEFMMWFFVVFIGGHLVGVVLAETRGDQGIVSNMINGGPKNS